MANKTIPRRWIDNYSDAIEALSRQAQEKAADGFARIPLGDIDAARQAYIDLMQAICGAYTDSAATVAARFYEICRKRCLGEDYEALSDSQREPDATRVAVLGIVNAYEKNGNAESLLVQLLERIDYEIKRAAADCTFANMEIDPYRGE